MNAQIGNRVYFSEAPAYMWKGTVEPYGLIQGVANGEVVVHVKGKRVVFTADGSPWSGCGGFKREPWNYQPEGELPRESVPPRMNALAVAREILQHMHTCACPHNRGWSAERIASMMAAQCELDPSISTPDVLHYHNMQRVTAEQRAQACLVYWRALVTRRATMTYIGNKPDGFLVLVSLPGITGLDNLDDMIYGPIQNVDGGVNVNGIRITPLHRIWDAQRKETNPYSMGESPQQG